MNYFIIDAFASRPFTGNPAAVVPLASPLPDSTLQSLAAEFSLAETAFPLQLAASRFQLRWFTPTREVPLCGHATLAAAHALWQCHLAPPDNPITFLTRASGQLICHRRAPNLISMDFPATSPQPAPLPPNAARALNIPGPILCLGATPMNLTLLLPTAQQVRDCKPDLAALATWHPIGVTITAPSDDPEIDFVSRFFAPSAGVPEDPVTGSAHCALAPYWAAQMGRNTLRARQLSPRGGEIQLELHADRVHLLGQAITTMQGQLLCAAT